MQAGTSTLASAARLSMLYFPETYNSLTSLTVSLSACEFQEETNFIFLSQWWQETLLTNNKVWSY